MRPQCRNNHNNPQKAPAEEAFLSKLRIDCADSDLGSIGTDKRPRDLRSPPGVLRNVVWPVSPQPRIMLRRIGGHSPTCRYQCCAIKLRSSETMRLARRFSDNRARIGAN